MIFTSFYLSLFIIFICFVIKGKTVEMQQIYISNLSNFSLRVYTGFSRKKKFLFGGYYQVWKMLREREFANCLRISSRADIFNINYKAIVMCKRRKRLIIVYSIIFPVFKSILL